MKNRVIPIIILLLCLTVTLAAPAMAAQKPVKKTGAGANYVGTYIDVTVSNDINLGVMTVGGTTTGSATCTVSTDADTWTVNVSDTATGDSGHMASIGPVYLSQQLQIGKTSPANNNASGGFTYNQTDGLTNLPFYVSQHVGTNDTPGSYSITITFVGSYNN